MLFCVDVDTTDLVQALDRVGIVAFALSGVELGARRRLDLFGLLVMGVVTATGGGLVRDVILGRIPFVLEHPDYLLWAVLSSSIAIATVWVGRTIPRRLVTVADAAGLGAFAAAGALAALNFDLAMPAVVLLAIVTATGGGVIRDLLADRVPLVLRSEVNATAAALGGFVVWLLEPLSNGTAALAGVAVTSAVRVITLAYGIHLPSAKRRR